MSALAHRMTTYTSDYVHIHMSVKWSISLCIQLAVFVYVICCT